MKGLRNSNGSRAAREISQLMEPPILLLLGMALLLTAAPTAGTAEVSAALAYILVSIGAPVTIIKLRISQGKISRAKEYPHDSWDDRYDIPNRSERLVPFSWAAACALAGLLLLVAMRAPESLVRLSAGHAAIMVILLVTTLFWKISLHAAATAAIAVVVARTIGVEERWVVLPMFALVAYSRLRLKRHTLLQVLAGGCTGWLIAHIAFTV